VPERARANRRNLMRKALGRNGFVFLICLVALTFVTLPALAGGVNMIGQEHPGLAGQPAGNKMIGKVLWQPLKLFAGAGNFLDNMFKGKVGAAVKQAVTAPVNYPASVVVDSATLAAGNTMVYGSPGNEIIQLK